MYQRHLATPACPEDPDTHGLASYGHFASRDGVHWAQLPVAIWNGVEVAALGSNSTTRTPFDTQSIYSGSATVLPGLAPDGRGDGILQIYPGLCRKTDWPACSTGTLLAAAVPADYATDPLLRRWKKLGVVVEGTQRDPSSAFSMISGERRFRTVDAIVFGAASDRELAAGKLYRIGPSNMPVGECPSVYALPPSTPGFEADLNRLQTDSGGALLPTHVFKYGVRPTDPPFNGTGRGGDAYILGRYPVGTSKNTSANITTHGPPLRVDNGKCELLNRASVSDVSIERSVCSFAEHTTAHRRPICVCRLCIQGLPLATARARWGATPSKRRLGAARCGRRQWATSADARSDVQCPAAAAAVAAAGRDSATAHQRACQPECHRAARQWWR
jgi:hypothetical protein